MNRRALMKSALWSQRLCLALHIVLILLHIAVLVIWCKQAENRVVVSSANGSLVSTVAIAVCQVFITLYSAAIVYITQQLALRGNLAYRQTLTATHDKALAWTGLGSALVSLYRQFSIAASVLGTISITLYLLGVAILHVTTPAIVTFQLFNHSSHALAPIDLAIPIINASDYKPNNMWPDLLAALPYIPRVQEFATLGLHNNTLYDILQGNDNGADNISVHATTFNVTCGYLTNASAVPLADTMTLINGSIAAGNYRYTSNGEGYNFTTTAVVLPNSLNAAGGIALGLQGREQIFFSSANLRDSEGNLGPKVVLNPPFYPLSSQNSTQFPLHDLQIIGCTVSRYNQSAIVDPFSKELLSVDPPAVAKNSSIWQPWVASGETSSSDFNLLDWWSDAFELSPPVYTPNPQACPAAPKNIDYSLCLIYVTNSFLMDDMGIAPIWDAEDTQLPQFTLHQLENSLAKLSAAIYWISAHVPPSKFSNHSSPYVAASLQSDRAVVSELMYRLEVVVAPLLVGLYISIVLLLLAVTFILRSSGKDPAIHGFGILQLLWLLSSADPEEVGKWNSEVKEPSVNNLRQSGMFIIQHGDENDEAMHPLRISDEEVGTE